MFASLSSVMPAVLFLALLAAACSPVPPGARPLPRYDQAGNRYPDECMKDLTPLLADGAIQVLRRPQAEIQRLGDARRTFGRSGHGIALIQRNTDDAGRSTYIISISSELAEWQYEDSLRHELCHIVAGPYWHPIPD
jgi:hypothetical protein